MTSIFFEDPDLMVRALYAMECLLSLIWVVLLLVSLAALCIVPGIDHQHPARLRLLFALLAITSALRFFQALLHVIHRYTDTSNLFRHALFVLPIAFQGTFFSAVVASWADVLKPLAVTTDSFFSHTLIFNGLLYAAVIVDCVLYQVAADHGLEHQNVVVGWSDIVTTVLFAALLILYATYGVRLAKQLSGRIRLRSKRLRSVHARITAITAVSTVSFSLLAGILAAEGIHLVRTGQFKVTYGDPPEYVDTWWREGFIGLFQAIPVGAVLLLYFPRLESKDRDLVVSAHLGGSYPVYTSSVVI
jgi:hypothetical protein